MKRPWTYLVNPFEAVTDGSYRAMKKIGAFTFDVLSSKVPPPSFASSPDETRDPEEDAFFYGLYLRLKPVWENFYNKYTIWETSQGDRKFQSTKLAEQLKILSGIKITDWDLEVQRVYRKGSPEYARFFPKNRSPFQKGASQSRVGAVEALNVQVAADSGLPAALKNNVSDFLSELKKCYTDNNSEGSDTSNASADVEKARLALSVELFGVLCQLTDHYRNETDRVLNFFDMHEMRHHEQTTFNGTLKGNETAEVVARKLKADKQIKLVNGGDTQLKFYLVEQEMDGPGMVSVIVDARKEQKVKPDQLGNPAHRILKVQNLGMQEAHFTVDLE